MDRFLTTFLWFCFVLAYQGLVSASEDSTQQNCSKVEGKSFADNNKLFACHTCLGRDGANCDWGHVCCNTTCFKIEDTEHNLIAKGCLNTQVKELDGDSAKNVQLPNVKLPWDSNEVISGKAHYCHAFDFCNSAEEYRFSMLALLLSSAIAFMLS